LQYENILISRRGCCVKNGVFTQNTELAGVNSPQHLLAHALLGAAVSAATGNDALTGGISASSGEVTATLLSKYVYKVDNPSELTAEQKNTISNITTLAGVAIGSSTGEVTDAVNAGEAAQFNPEASYAEGQGVRQDYQKAFEWYTKAANQGNIRAQLNVGVMYEQGYGVRQDYRKAKEWFGKACDNGNQEGCDAYRVLNQHGF